MQNIETFKHTLTVNKRVFDQEAMASGTPNKWKSEPTQKEATFKELDENDVAQHDLHFEIMEFYLMGGGEDPAKGWYKRMAGLTRTFLATNLVVNEEFTGKDRELVINNSKTLLEFANWLLKEKIAPFFRTLTPVSTT